jgi:stress response protein YsnF/sporulation protein YlmC with PRC-barrel domain
MNSQMSVKKVEAGKHNLRIKVLLEKLRNKLKTFALLDNNGNFVGEVKDVKLDSDRQLNLVVAETAPDGSTRLVLLRSNHIQQVDSVTKSLFVDISKLEIDNLAEYQLLEPESLETTRSSRVAQVTPEVIDRHTTSPTDSSLTDQLNARLGKATFGNVASGEEARYHAKDMTTLADSEYNQEEPDMEGSTESARTDVVEEEVFRLLAERLIVDRSKRKAGEVIVRKEVETRMVEVPVRYEKLIVEQVSPEHKQLAEILLGNGEITGVELTQSATSQAQPTDNSIASGEFNSPKSASLFLNAVALQRHHGCAKVRIELVLEDEELQKTYQEWFERCAGS